MHPILVVSLLKRSRGWSVQRLNILWDGNLPPPELLNGNSWVRRSCGREMLAHDKPDTFKVSYYMNCAFYKDHSLDGAQGNYPHLPDYTKGNIWPREELLCGFKETMQEIVGQSQCTA